MINAEQLIREDPHFVFYAAAVMHAITGMEDEEWIYELWKAYQTQIPPEQFAKEVLGDK